MKSGNNKSVTINTAEYRDLHLAEDCTGTMEMVICHNRPLDIDGLGALPIPHIPMIGCRKCGASFVAPLFQDWISDIVARRLITSPGLLDKKQLRFLRIYFGLTQEGLASGIGISDRHELSKMESRNFPTKNMPDDKQIRLKILYAKILKIDNVEEIYRATEAAENVIEITRDWFPSEADIHKKIG